MKNNVRVFSFCAVVVAISLSASSQAQNAFNTFGPGQSYNTGTGWTISGSSFTFGNFAPAMGFTSAATGNLDNVALALGGIAGTGVVVSLFTDNAGMVGTVLESWTVTSMPSFGSGGAPVVLANAVSGLSLTAGTSYWLGAAPIDAGSLAAWNWNNQGITGPFSDSADGGMTYPTPRKDTLSAFSVTVTPEPSSIAVMGLGLLPLLTLRRKSARK
jgi:hypothetical protein